MDCERGDRECDGSSAAITPPPFSDACIWEHTLTVKLPQTVIHSTPPRSCPLYYGIHTVCSANDRQLVCVFFFLLKKAVQTKKVKGSTVSEGWGNPPLFRLIKYQHKCLLLRSQLQCYIILGVAILLIARSGCDDDNLLPFPALMTVPLLDIWLFFPGRYMVKDPFNSFQFFKRIQHCLLRVIFL